LSFAPGEAGPPGAANTANVRGETLALACRLAGRLLDRAKTRASATLDVADEHDLQIWKALGRCLLGAANTGVGQVEEGLAHIRQGWTCTTG
jgi:hypothetical protein